MRFFALLNFQHVILYVFPTLIFILIFASALGFLHFQTKGADERKNKILYRFPDNIEDRNAPFPLSMILMIAGTLLWMFFYILGIGLLEVRI